MSPASCDTSSSADRSWHNFAVISLIHSTRHFTRTPGDEAIWSRGGQVPDCRSHAKYRRRVRKGTVTPRLELMTLDGNRLSSPTPTRVAGGFAPVSAPTGTTRERQLQHTSLTLGKATTCSPDQGQTITLPTVCNPTHHTGGDHQRRWQ